MIIVITVESNAFVIFMLISKLIGLGKRFRSHFYLLN